LDVRFLSLRLPDGKLEALVTTLLDEQSHPRHSPPRSPVRR
jgi:hypothetical protein